MTQFSGLSAGRAVCIQQLFDKVEKNVDRLCSQRRHTSRITAMNFLLIKKNVFFLTQSAVQALVACKLPKQFIYN